MSWSNFLFGSITGELLFLWRSRSSFWVSRLSSMFDFIRDRRALICFSAADLGRSIFFFFPVNSRAGQSLEPCEHKKEPSLEFKLSGFVCLFRPDGFLMGLFVVSTMELLDLACTWDRCLNFPWINSSCSPTWPLRELIFFGVLVGVTVWNRLRNPCSDPGSGFAFTCSPELISVRKSLVRPVLFLEDGCFLYLLTDRLFSSDLLLVDGCAGMWRRPRPRPGTEKNVLLYCSRGKITVLHYHGSMVMLMQLSTTTSPILPELILFYKFLKSFRNWIWMISKNNRKSFLKRKLLFTISSIILF